MVEFVDGSVIEKFEAFGDGGVAGGEFLHGAVACSAGGGGFEFSFSIGPGVPKIEVVFGLDGTHGIAAGSGVFIVNFEDSAGVGLFFSTNGRGE